MASTPSFAQAPERLPWFVADLHAAWVGLPTAEGWVPTVPIDTPLPGRGWGAGGGVTVYPVKFGLVTIGIGASVMTGRGASDPVTTKTGTGPTEVTKQVTTSVTTRITSLHPQVSFNFGRRLGWSYLSAGLGRSKVASSSEAFGTALAQTVPESWSGTLNFGGGARWFMKPRLGAGFDVRFTTLSSRAATDLQPVFGKRTRMFTISAGISIQ
jgi:hypothetical protein